MDTEIKATQEAVAPQAAPVTEPGVTPTKFCKHCGKKINDAAVICPHCGCQVETLKQETPSTQPNIVINNANTNTNTNLNAGYVVAGKPKNKWVSIILCLFLGVLGAHKFYEGKTGMGVLYLFTFGLCGIGIVVDLISLLLKPNPYFV